MTQKLKLLMLLIGLSGTTSAQIVTPTTIVTPTSVTLPDSLPNYNGTYDDFGQAHLFYPNDGEVRFADESQASARETVAYYTMNTHPKQYLLSNNNITLMYNNSAFASVAAGIPDSLHRIDLEWTRSNSSAFLAKIDEQDNAQLNYFTQWFASGGRTSVKGSAAVACQSVYYNIDLVYTSNNAGLVMYFIVYPGGDYKDILMHINGSKANSLVGSKLKIDANWESTTFEKPDMYQYVISGSNVITPVNICNASWTSLGGDDYQIDNNTPYNGALPLIIQIKQNTAVVASTAGLTWSTYFGGSQLEFLSKTHCDNQNNLYVAGYSNSGNNSFPQAQGVSSNPNNNGDGVIAKFDNAGVLQWSTFVGGSSKDEIHDFDFKGSAITCVGKTASGNLVPILKTGATNNPVFGGPNWDGFIFEFEFNTITSQFSGNWLTYFGGNGDEELNACKFDGQNNLFIVGAGASTNMTPMGPAGSYQQAFNAAQILPSTPLSTDGIIVQFNSSSLQSWFTFYGTDALGTNAHTYAADYLYGLAISGSDVYACGKAGGSNLPNSYNSKLVSNNFDGMLVHFTTSGKINSSDAKYTDGNLVNYSVKVFVGDVYTVGQADTSMNPVNSGVYYYNGSASGTSDACFSVHAHDLSATLHNTYLGGDGEDAAYDIQFTNNSLFLIAGGTNSTDFPTHSLGAIYTHGANPNSGVYLNDNFVSCFEKNNTGLKWSTYLGSQWQESLQYPGGINFQVDIGNSTMALNSANDIHVLGSTTSFNTFPLDPWTGFPVYYQPQNSGGATNDATITRIPLSLMNSGVGFKDFENTEFLFGIYPNPTAKIISITHKALVTADLRFAIYDLSGKKLKTGSFKADEVKDVDVSFLPQGVYVINVSNGEKTYCNKFVKADN